MRSFNKIIGPILLLGILAACIFAARKIYIIFSSLNPTVAAGIIAASATIAVSVSSVFLTKWLEQKMKIANDHREKKIPIYSRLVDFFLGIPFSIGSGKSAPTEAEINDFITGFTKDVVVWGSDDVLLAYNKFRQYAFNMDSSKPSNELMFIMEELLLAVRRDLGHKNKGICRGKILGLFTIDVDSYMREAISMDKGKQ